MKLELKPFQEEGIKKHVEFLRTCGCCYNADEQGLGKTIQTIVAINILCVKKVLIICPAVVLYTWKKEIEIWASKIKVGSQLATPTIAVIDKGSRFKEAILTSNFVITSYGLASGIVGLTELYNRDWDVLVADESHMLKGKDTLRTRAVTEYLWKKAKYKICLSGTPFTQNVIDCYPVFSKMYSGFGSFYQFANKYTKVQRTPWGDKYNGLRNADKLREIIKANFFLRRTKEQVAKEIPDKQYASMYLGEEYLVKMTPEEKEAQEEYAKKIKALFAGAKTYGGRIPAPPKAVATKRYEQGVAKTKPIIEFVKNMLDQDEPVVLFAYHRDVIKRLHEALTPYRPVLITGDTSAAERAKAVQMFQDGETDLFIGQIVAAGTGITLTRSKTVVLAEIDWSPAVCSQAIDRLHRIGQKDTVTIYFFVVEGSIDEEIHKVVLKKSTEFKEILEG